MTLTAKDHKKIGLRLQNTRKSYKMSLADISSSIRVKESLLQAIEDGEWRKLPGETYARGYIRQYAAILKISNPLDVQKDKQTLGIKKSKHKTKLKDSIPTSLFSEAYWFNGLLNYWKRVRKNSLGGGIYRRRRSLLAETHTGFSSPVIAMMIIIIFIILGTSTSLWFILSKQKSVHEIKLVREIPEKLQYILTEVKPE